MTAESLSRDDRAQLMESLLAPLLDRYSAVISRDLPAAPDIRTHDQLMAFLSFAILAFTRISKGLNGDKVFNSCVFT